MDFDRADASIETRSVSTLSRSVSIRVSMDVSTGVSVTDSALSRMIWGGEGCGQNQSL